MQYANQMAEAMGLSTNNVAYRKGGLYQVLQPLWSNGSERDVTWGRTTATFNDTSADTFAHEFGHTIQVYQQGWGAFQGREIYEQLIWGLDAYDPFLHPNSNEVGARNLERKYSY